MIGARPEEVPPVDHKALLNVACRLPKGTAQSSRGAKRSRCGQAVMELMLGLSAIALLIAGLWQVARLSGVSFSVQKQMRLEMAQRLTDPDSNYDEGFVFATQTDPGPDGKIYTADDRVVVGDDEFYQNKSGYLNMVTYPVLKDYFSAYELSDPLYDLAESDLEDVSEHFQVYRAAARARMPVVPMLRRLQGKKAIHLHRYLWMPALGEVME